MGQHVAQLSFASSVVRLVGLVGLAGCSLLYNPDKLPAAPDDADSNRDAEVILDADPAQLELVSVSPAVVVEGTGTGGGRAGILTIQGTQMVPGATVMITPHGAGAPMITVDNLKVDVAADGRMLAVPITLPVDLTLDAATRLRLDVTVTQPAGGSTVSRTLSQLDANDTPVLELQGLDELTDPNPALASGVHEYSQVQISGNLTATDTAEPLILRATGSISIGGTTQVNANKDVPGPGGNAGGAGGVLLAGGLVSPGSPGGGAGGGKKSGGGGGFALMGGGANGGLSVGDPQISSHAAPNRGNGGAGGDSGLSAGGKGGGGGGTIELTAGGSITVGQVEAKGGVGSSGANTGGGGSGGVVLLRSAVSITAAGVTVAGGTGANTGSVGRIRLDVPAATPTTTPAAYRGPTFAADTVLITRTEQPSLTVFGEEGGTFQYRFSNDANMVRGPFSQGIAGGASTFPLAEPLFRGLNTVCLQVEGGGSTPEARNCIQIVYLFTP